MDALTARTDLDRLLCELDKAEELYSPKEVQLYDYTGYYLPNGVMIGVYYEDGRVNFTSIDGVKKTYKPSKHEEELFLNLFQSLLKHKYSESTASLWIVYGGGMKDNSIYGSDHISTFVYVFGAQIDDKWVRPEKLNSVHLPKERVFSISEFPSFDLTMEYGVETVLNDRLKIDPVGAQFNKEGKSRSILCLPKWPFTFQRTSYWLIYS
jgi:hypothetical protein